MFEKDLTDDDALSLLQQLAQGNSVAFWELWEKYKDILYGICFQQMGGNPEDAKDTLSGVMLKAFDKLPKYAEKITNPKAWLIRFTYNFCIDIHRARKRRAKWEAKTEVEPDTNITDPARPDESPEESLLSRYDQEEVRRLIDNLSPRLREVFALKFLHNYSYQGIAERLNLPPATVRKRVQRARELLNKQIARPASQRPERPKTESEPKRVNLLDLTQEIGAEVGMQEEISFEPAVMRAVSVTLESGVEKDFYIALAQKPTRLQTRLETLKKYVQMHPAGWKKRFELAQVFYALGYWTETIKEYQALVKVNPRCLDAWLNLGNLLSQVGKPDEAIESFNKALPISRRVATRHHLKGLIEACGNKYHSAIEEFERALSLEPRTAPHRHALGIIHVLNESPNEALRVFDDLLKTNPRDVLGLNYSLQSLQAMDRITEAEQRAKLILEIDAENIPALKWLADHRCTMRLIRGEEGKVTRNLIRKMLTIAPDIADVRDTLALYHIARGEWGKGIAELSAFTKSHPNKHQGWYHYARWLHSTGKYKEAADAIMIAYGLCKEDLSINKAICEILSSAQEREGLGMLLTEMLDRFPEQWSMWATAGLALNGRDPQHACSTASRATELQPQLAQPWLSYGQVLALARRHAEAIEALEKCWKILPEQGAFYLSVEAALKLGESYTAIGDKEYGLFWWKEAAHRAVTLTTIDPAVGNYQLANAAELLNDRDSALRACSKALGYNLLFPAREKTRQAMRLLRAKA